MADHATLAALVTATTEQAQMAQALIAEQPLPITLYVYHQNLISELAGYHVVIAPSFWAAELRRTLTATIIELKPDLPALLAAMAALYQHGARMIALIDAPSVITAERSVSFQDKCDATFWAVPDLAAWQQLLASAQPDYCDAVITWEPYLEQLEELSPVKYCLSFELSPTAIRAALTQAQLLLSAPTAALAAPLEEGIVLFSKQELSWHNERAATLLADFPQELWYQTLSPLFTQTQDGPTVVNLEQDQLLMHHRIRDGQEVVLLQAAPTIEQHPLSLRQERRCPRSAASTFDDIIAQDPSSVALIERAKLFARTTATVLISGETGVGKAKLAQALHNYSERRTAPFVAVNCATLPPDLIAGTLFGYGAGARAGQAGLLERAQLGTIFLDEIDELSLELQSRLLRVLQEHEVMRVGADTAIPLDVRVICATKRDLLQLAQQGSFRLDLYYRLNVLALPLAPLRARPHDIMALFTHYLNQFLGTKPQLDPEVEAVLTNYSWPGNVRELRNVAEAVALYGPHLTGTTLRGVMGLNQPHVAPALPPKPQAPALSGNDSQIDATGQVSFQLSFAPGFSLRDVEHAVLKELLRHKSAKEVCAMLSINRVTLWRKLKDIGSQPER